METDNSYYNRFTQDITVPCSDTDSSFHMKPAAFMDHAQELAFNGARLLNFGYDELQKHHTAWVLSRMHIKFADPPKWRDETTLFTWHKGLEGLFFLRDFELRAKGDTDFEDKSKVLVSCTTSWIIMNMETRRLVRSDDVMKIVPSSTQCPDDAIVERCAKVVMPKDAEPELVGEHLVSYSDVDILGHTNNTRYVVWAMDCIDYEYASSTRVKELEINFNKETKPGETVSLYRFIQETETGKDIFIEGKIEGKSCFCVKFQF